MLAGQMPYHLRNTVERLDLPIFVELEENQCRVPPNLALGDTLMVLGVLRNQGKPVTLHAPGAAKEILQGHPLVRELAASPEPPRNLQVKTLPVASSGRDHTWESGTIHTLKLPVLPVDQVKANHILAHSLYYRMSRREDWPSVFVDPARPRHLAGIMSSQKPNLVIYGLNPGRHDYNWQDQNWWLQLAKRLKGSHCLIGVGAQDYGELGAVLDFALPMNDPGSTLLDLAWLFQECQGFIGRDGGLSHLASAVNRDLVVLWDSMLSYRHWATSAGHHILMANPYSFRYPQTVRLGTADLKEHFRRVPMTRPEGGEVMVELPEEGYEQEAARIFGSLENLAMVVLARLTVEEDRRSVAQWAGEPELKKSFHEQSLDFACRALSGGLRAGENWVAPLMP